MYKNEEILGPPGYQPTEKEISLAKANYVMKNYIHRMLEQLSTYHDMQQGIIPKDITTERCHELAENASQQWKNVKKNSNSFENSLFDGFISDEEFHKRFVEGLSSMHVGDCTSFPATCTRCYAEGLFDIDYTATWTQKEGYQLLEEYCADYNEKNPDDDMND